MTKKYYITLTATVVLLSACSASVSAPKADLSKLQQLKTSLNSWQQLKKDKGRHYQYSVAFTSWVGFGNVTTITVKNDAVSKRYYDAFDRVNKIKRVWEENTINIIGTNKEGAKAKTIDQLYQSCAADILSVSQIQNNIRLSFDEHNLLKQCVYIPKNCSDDCSSGINISDIEFISQ